MVEKPGSPALVGPGLLIGHLLGVTTLRSTAGGPEVSGTHKMHTCMSTGQDDASMEKHFPVKDIVQVI